MYRCILINRGWLTDSLLHKYIQRIGCLDIIWSGAYSNEALRVLQSKDFDLVFASLPEPNQVINESLVDELRKQQSLIITSSYPEYLFSGYKLKPISFLKEPFTINSFRAALEVYIDSADTPNK